MPNWHRSLVLSSLACSGAYLACGGSNTAKPPGGPSGLVCPGSKAGVKSLHFGDLHVHTNYSFDAYFFNQLNGPKEAFAFAKGGTAELPCGDVSDVSCESVKLDAPLDFAAVTDHSELIGGFVTLCGVDGQSSQNPSLCSTIAQYARTQVAQIAVGGVAMGPGIAGVAQLVPSIADTTDAWGRSVAFSDAADDPCKFTAFTAYEYTGEPNGAMFHRNIIFNGTVMPKKPVSSLDVGNEWELWNALDAVCAHDASCDYVSIPHNANMSDGRMFQSPITASGAPVTQAQIEQRARADVLVEVMQHKGESECGVGYKSPLMADEDTECRFEKTKPICTGAATDPSYCKPECDTVATDADGGAASPPACTARLDMVRDALVEGMRVADQYQGVNPIKLGLVGSSDTHNGDPGNVREDTFRGHGGILDDAPPELLGAWACNGGSISCAPSARTFAPDAFRLNPGGLTGVWAEENTRASLFAALKRRETYATSGPRIAVKVYASWGALPQDSCATLAAGGNPAPIGGATVVPMGGDLPAPPAGAAPQLVVRAVADPIMGTPMQRIEVIKGWVDASGTPHAKLFTLAGAASGPAPAADCSATKAGQPEQLCGLWSDPEFDPTERALYYARVLENPTCRWSTWMCVRQKVDCTAIDPMSGALPGSAAGYEGCCTIAQGGAGYSATNRFDTIEERAWTSPVWYQP